MKRLISIFLTVCMCFSIGMVLTACGDNENHEHTYKTEWTYDDMYHWHACEGEDCAEASDKAEHTWNGGEITTEATAEADGVKTFTCTVCGKTKTETVEYVETNKVVSNFSLFYSAIGDDVLYIVEKDDAGALKYIYYTESIYGEDSPEDSKRSKAYSFEYENNGILKNIYCNNSYYYEISYNENGVPSYAIAYRSDTDKKVENGRSLTFSYPNDAENGIAAIVIAYDVRGDATHYLFGENRALLQMIEDENVAFFEYDDMGRLTATQVYDLSDTDTPCDSAKFAYSGDKTLPDGYELVYNGELDFSASDITYDDEYNILSISCAEYDDGEIAYCHTVVYQYDDTNRLVKVEISDDDSYEVYEVSYDENGNMLSEIGYERSDSGELIRSYMLRYEYDANGNKTLSEYSYPIEDGVYVSSSSYTYDDFGRITSRMSGSSATYYTYDENGLLIKTVDKDADHEIERPSTIQYTFDSNGRLIRRIERRCDGWHYDDDTETEVIFDYITTTYSYSYNSNGRLSAYFDGSGHEYRFEYDADGRINAVSLTYQYERWSDSLNDYEQKTGTGTNTYTYSENGELISAVICEWDYENECYVAITYDYTTIK